MFCYAVNAPVVGCTKSIELTIGAEGVRADTGRGAGYGWAAAGRGGCGCDWARRVLRVRRTIIAPAARGDELLV
jgi:hypothetical protein